MGGECLPQRRRSLLLLLLLAIHCTSRGAALTRRGTAGLHGDRRRDALWVHQTRIRGWQGRENHNCKGGGDPPPTLGTLGRMQQVREAVCQDLPGAGGRSAPPADAAAEDRSLGGGGAMMISEMALQVRQEPPGAPQPTASTRPPHTHISPLGGGAASHHPTCPSTTKNRRQPGLRVGPEVQPRDAPGGLGPNLGVAVPRLAGGSSPGKRLSEPDSPPPSRPKARKNKTSNGEADGINPFLFIQGRLFLNKGYIVPFVCFRFIITLSL